jgi:hypothetical protein
MCKCISWFCVSSKVLPHLLKKNGGDVNVLFILTSLVFYKRSTLLLSLFWPSFLSESPTFFTAGCPIINIPSSPPSLLFTPLLEFFGQSFNVFALVGVLQKEVRRCCVLCIGKVGRQETNSKSNKQL